MRTCCPQCQHYFSARKVDTKSPKRVKAGAARWKGIEKSQRSEIARDAARARWAAKRAADALLPICKTCVQFVPATGGKDLRYGYCKLRGGSGVQAAETLLKASCGQHAFLT